MMYVHTELTLEQTWTCMVWVHLHKDFFQYIHTIVLHDVQWVESARWGTLDMEEGLCIYH